MIEILHQFILQIQDPLAPNLNIEGPWSEKHGCRKVQILHQLMPDKIYIGVTGDV